MERRQFLIGAATGLAGVGRAWTRNRSDDKLSRIAIMMYGLHGIVKTNQPPSPERTLDIMDIGQFCADQFHVHQVELQSNYFPSTEVSWLKDFRARLDKTKTRVVQVNLELGIGFGAGGLNITAESQPARLTVIDIHRHWLERIVPLLGCPRVLVNQGQPSEQNKQLAISTLRAIVDIGKAKNIIVSMENRDSGGARGRPGGPGAPAAPGGGRTAQAPPAPSQPPGPPSYLLLMEVIKGAGARACCDLVNFPSESEQQDGIRAMLPMTSGLLHPGGQFDLVKAMAVIRSLGYKGLYSIKWNWFLPGNPVENTHKIMDVVLGNM